MAKNKKPKFLEKETPELLDMLKGILTDDEMDEKKALKITEELISRQPSEESPASVDEALESAASMMTEVLGKIKAAYENEIALIENTDTSSEEEEEEEEETPKKVKKTKKAKKNKKEDDDEPDDDESDDDDDDEPDDDDESDDDEDYSDWSIKDLKKECRTRGIKVNKSTSKADMVKALEADDKE